MEGAQSIEEIFPPAPGFATIEKNAQTQSIVDPTFTRRLTERLVRTFLSAPNADVASFMRISTSAFEVSEESMIEPRYLNYFVKSTKPTVEPSALRMSKRDVSALQQSTRGVIV